MDFTTNYCGMYYSDGKIQSSVANGSTLPIDDLDNACRDHDTAYALAENDDDLDVADDKFYKTTNSLGIRGKAYGRIVKHGNQIIRKSKMAFLLPFGTLIGYSLGATSLLSGLLPRRNGGLRGTKVSPNVSNDLVYNPYEHGISDAVSGEVVDAKKPPAADVNPIVNDEPGDAVVNTHYFPNRTPYERAWAMGLYQPLKRKKIKKTKSLIKLHYKYNPPGNKQKSKQYNNNKNGSKVKNKGIHAA